MENEGELPRSKDSAAEEEAFVTEVDGSTLEIALFRTIVGEEEKSSVSSGEDTCDGAVSERSKSESQLVGNCVEECDCGKADSDADCSLTEPVHDASEDVDLPELSSTNTSSLSLPI